MVENCITNKGTIARKKRGLDSLSLACALGVMRLTMRNIIVLALIFANAFAFSTPVPEAIEITPQNSVELGFSLDDVGVSAPEEKVVKLNFPVSLKNGNRAKRVQTYLFDLNGKQLSLSSADYNVGSKLPSLLLQFNPGIHDAALVIQYFCKNNSGAHCAQAYTISSVKKYLITKQSSGRQ